MEPNATGEKKVSLRYVTIGVDPDGVLPLVCLDCGRSLDVHQPDPELPDRMLATCDVCTGWHLVNCDTDGSAAVVVLLPDHSLFRGRP